MFPTWLYLPPDTASPHATWGVIVLFGGLVIVVPLVRAFISRLRHLRRARHALQEIDAAVAPFRYSVILWAVLAGYLVWRDVPDAASWTGIAVVTAAGIYTFLREQRLARATR